MENLKSEIIKLLDEFNKGNKISSFKKINLLYKKLDSNLEVKKIYADMAVNINEIDIAIKVYKEILIKQPHNLNCLEKLQSLFLKIGKNTEALVYSNKVLKINSNNFIANKCKGFILFEKEDYNNAKKYIYNALKKDPENYFLLNIKGLILFKNRDFKAALNIFKDVIKINNEYIDGYNNLGTCYFELENFNKSFLNFKKAFRLDKNNFITLMNLGNILSVINKNKFALIFFKKALKLNSKDKRLISNMAMCYIKSRDTNNIEKFFKKSLEINPNDSELKYAYSTFKLSVGDFKKGWKFFDYRISTEKNYKSATNFNVLKNNLTTSNNIDYSKKTLVVREQGLGDEIFFSRIYPYLIDVFKDIKIESDIRLLNVFNDSFKKKVFYPTGYFSSNKDEIERFGNVFYAGSLLKFFIKNEDEINNGQYIYSKNEKIIYVKKFLNNKLSKNKIGLSWKSKLDIFGKLKSISLEDFEGLFNEKRVFINLQYGDVKYDIEKINLKGHQIINFTEFNLFKDLEACIALLKNLDLFITIDNSTAHLAGALGVKTILILPKNSPDYFYWREQNEFSIWYKSIKIIKNHESKSKMINKINNIISNLE